MTEQRFKLGRRPPKEAPALDFARFFTGIVPAHPAKADNLGRITDWAMLGNDQWGNCVAVTWANERHQVTSYLTDAAAYPDLDEVLALYRTQNPGFPSQDDGMDIQTCLEYLVKSGGPDGVKAIAFAKVDHTKPDQVEAAIAIFGNLWTGITVLDVNQTEFGQGKPWDYDPSSPVDGGHSVLVGGYSGDAADDEAFITWAQRTGFTDAFWAHLVEEAWVVIWPEHLGSKAFLEGISLDVLATDFKALTGDPLPLPTPNPAPPAPSPTPPPVPPAPSPQPDLEQRLLRAIEKAIRAVLHEFFG